MEENKKLLSIIELYNTALGLRDAQKLIEDKLKPTGSPVVVVPLPDALDLMTKTGEAILKATDVIRAFVELKAEGDNREIKDLFDTLQDSFNLN